MQAPEHREQDPSRAEHREPSLQDPEPGAGHAKDGHARALTGTPAGEVEKAKCWPGEKVKSGEIMSHKQV